MSTEKNPVAKRHYPKSTAPVSTPSEKTSPLTHFKRELASWSRWLHIYLSMVSFAILFFFAITGLTLNHPDFMGDQQVINFFEGSIDQSWLGGDSLADIAQLEIVEFIRSEHGVEGALSDFRIDEYECAVSFKGPGYSADAFIDRESGNYELTETRLGFIAVVNDLHKGRDSGSPWAAVIDISAILMCFVSLTGFILIFFIKRKRFNGLLLVGSGLLLCYLVYLFLVP